MKDKYVALFLGVLYFVMGIAYLVRETFTERSVGIIIAGCGLLCMIHMHEFLKKREEEGEGEEEGEEYPETVVVRTTSLVSWTGPKDELLKLIAEFEEAGWKVCPSFQRYKDRVCFLEEGKHTTTMLKDDD